MTPAVPAPPKPIVSGDADELSSTTATDLLLRVGQRDRAAFAALFDRFAPLVHGVSLRAVRDHAVAEDLSRRTFLEVWRRAERLDPAPRHVETWIVGLAHRHAATADVPSSPRGLSTLERDSVDLAYFGGLTYGEIALRLDVSRALVVTAMRDGLIRMQAPVRRSGSTAAR